MIDHEDRSINLMIEECPQAFWTKQRVADFELVPASQRVATDWRQQLTDVPAATGDIIPLTLVPRVGSLGLSRI